MNRFEIRFKYDSNFKIIHADTEETAERMYQKIVQFAKCHYKPISGQIALFDGSWLVKSEKF